MKAKLVILLALVLAAIIGLAVFAMRHSQHETQPTTEDSRAVQRNSGEFLAPDTANDVLGAINKKPARSPEASAQGTPAP